MTNALEAANIKAKKGCLVRLNFFPWVATKEEISSFHKIVRTKGRVVYVAIPKRLASNPLYKEDCLGVHTDYVTEIKGYFSNS